MTEQRGADFVIPEWAAAGTSVLTRTCRSCNARIALVTTVKTGKWAPIDPDGTSHFATCPQAEVWRRP